jgi:hypothetical protein
MDEQTTAYIEAVTKGTEGMQAISSGECPGCEQCAESHRMTPEEHASAWHSGTIEGYSSDFSWRPCGICGTHLGGDREVWHWIQGNPGEDLKGREINHESDMCRDCVLYLANGDLPEQWSR